MFIKSPLANKPQEFVKPNEGMLWHVRPGHTSLNYLKKLQKIEKKLEKIKFDDHVLKQKWTNCHSKRPKAELKDRFK